MDPRRPGFLHKLVKKAKLVYFINFFFNFLPFKIEFNAILIIKANVAKVECLLNIMSYFSSYIFCIRFSLRLTSTFIFWNLRLDGATSLFRNTPYSSSCLLHVEWFSFCYAFACQDRYNKAFHWLLSFSGVYWWIWFYVFISTARNTRLCIGKKCSENVICSAVGYLIFCFHV